MDNESALDVAKVIADWNREDEIPEWLQSGLNELPENVIDIITHDAVLAGMRRAPISSVGRHIDSVITTIIKHREKAKLLIAEKEREMILSLVKSGEIKRQQVDIIQKIIDSLEVSRLKYTKDKNTTEQNDKK